MIFFILNSQVPSTAIFMNTAVDKNMMRYDMKQEYNVARSLAIRYST